MTVLPEMTRALSPFEHQVLTLLCDGLTNAAIAREVRQSEKVIENTVSRVSKAFTITDRDDHNLRVAIAIAYRINFGDTTLEKINKLLVTESPSTSTQTDITPPRRNL